MLRLFFATVMALVICTPVSAQLYFSDNFNSADTASIAGRVPSGGIGGTWTESSPGASTVGIVSNVMTIDNNTDNDNNAYGAATIGNNFSSTTLTALPRWVEWRFNMRIGVSPSGFGGTQNGVAFVLAANNANFDTATAGYAVIFGRNGSQFELATFNTGLDGTLSAFAASSTAPITPNTDWASVRVTYNPTNDNWQLFVRDDGGTQVDPFSGNIPAVTGLVANTTFTGTSGMNQLGGYLSYDSTNDRLGQFDNVTLQAVPEPTTWALIGLSVAGLTYGGYRYRRQLKGILNKEVDVEEVEVA